MSAPRDDGPSSAPGLISFSPDWTLALPTYERSSCASRSSPTCSPRSNAEAPEIIHVATPGPVGVCGLVAAKLLDIPLVGSYHTELGPYALHLTRDALVARRCFRSTSTGSTASALSCSRRPLAVADALAPRASRASTSGGVASTATASRRAARSDMLRGGCSTRAASCSCSRSAVSRTRSARTCSSTPSAACTSDTPDARLAIVGDGPARARLEASAPRGVDFARRGARRRRSPTLRERRHLLLPEDDRHLRAGAPRGRRQWASRGRGRRGRRARARRARPQRAARSPERSRRVCRRAQDARHVCADAGTLRGAGARAGLRAKLGELDRAALRGIRVGGRAGAPSPSGGAYAA